MRYTFVILFFIFGCAKQSDTDNEQITAKVRYYNTKYNEYQRVNINIAQTYIDSIQTLSKNENYVKGMGIATLDKGLLENIKGNFNLAINKNEKALSIFNELKETVKFIASEQNSISSLALEISNKIYNVK